jgi:hypothetical protein
MDSESGSEKDDAGNEAKVGAGLVATMTLEAELESDSED